MNGFLRCGSHGSGFRRVTCIRVDLSIGEIILEQCEDEGIGSIAFFLIFCMHNSNQFIQQAVCHVFLCLHGTIKSLNY